MLEKVKMKEISIEKMVEKMAHSPADLFAVHNRGYIREGYFADLVVVSPNENQIVSKENCLYKCAWSPFEGKLFNSSIRMTMINGNVAYQDGQIIEYGNGMRLEFKRPYA